MDSKVHLVETLAKERRVEAMVENIAHHALTPELKDLCQMVYLILLEYDEAKLLDLWRNNQINFFLARIIVNQYKSSNSPYHYLFRRVQERTVFMGVGGEISDAVIDKIAKNYVPRRDKDR